MNRFYKQLLVLLSIVGMWGLIGMNKPAYAATTATNYTPDAYDLSQWQSLLSDSQVAKLKSEVKFVILRVQYGSSYKDTTFQQNMQKLAQAKIPYGVYSYSMYTSTTDAQNEARQLYQLAPNARFYVNDAEEINTNPKSQFVPATIAWASQMRALTKKPIVLYSYQSMLDNELTNARSSYDTIWLANYTQYEPQPSYHYDLWQFTDRYPSQALQQNVDASVIPQGGKSLLTFKQSTTKQPTVTSTTKLTATKSKTTIKKQVVKKTVKATTKKATKKTTTKNYYDDTKTVFVEITNPKGIPLYDGKTHQKVKQLPMGRYLLVNHFFTYHGHHYAMGTNNQYYSALKSDIKPITAKKTLQSLTKTLGQAK